MKTLYDVQIIKIGHALRTVRVTKRPKDRERNLNGQKWVFAQTTHVVGWKLHLAWMSSLLQVDILNFHENRLSDFQDMGVLICPYSLLWLLVLIA